MVRKKEKERKEEQEKDQKRKGEMTVSIRDFQDFGYSNSILLQDIKNIKQRKERKIRERGRERIRSGGKEIKRNEGIAKSCPRL